MTLGKKHSPAFKFKIAMEALQGRPIADICREYHLASSLVHKWKETLKKSGTQVFGQTCAPGDAEQQQERVAFSPLIRYTFPYLNQSKMKQRQP